MTKAGHQQVRRESPRFKYQLTQILFQLRKWAMMRVARPRMAMAWVTPKFANLQMAMHRSKVLMCSRLLENVNVVITKMVDRASFSFYQAP